MLKVGKERKEKKLKSLLRLYEILGKYKQIVCISLLNVGSTQIQQARKQLAVKKGLLVIGKNTLVKKAVSWRANRLPEGAEYDEFRKFGGPIPELRELIPQLCDKIGFIFTDQPIFEVKKIVESNKVAAPAKVGIVSPSDVTIPPGPTGMDPSQISFFHALQIPTKIVKNQIEIVKDYSVCIKGKKVGNSEVILLQKMGIKPFFYSMSVMFAYDNGSILNQEVCSLDPEDIASKFSACIRNFAALSLEIGDINEVSAPVFLTNAFKNLAAIGLETGYKFKQIEGAGSAPQQAAKQADQPQNAPKVEAPVEEAEEDMDVGGLFN